MIALPQPKSRPAHSAFTLVELLMVVAIIAVVGTGVAVSYGRKMVDDSKDQLTLHEMHEIKKAFLRFHSDNHLRLQRGMVGHAGNALPSPAFSATFAAAHADNALFDGRMEFFETYGLWFLMQRRVSGAAPEFEDYDVLTGEGWNGPYLDVNSRQAWSFGGLDFPQIADKYNSRIIDGAGNPTGVYRLLYYEHCQNLADLSQPIYRRLLLVASRGNENWDEMTSAELLSQTGNLRGGSDAGRLNLSTGAFENRINEGDEYAPASPFFVLELLNMDQFRQ